MRALLCERFGPPDTLVFRDVSTPEPGPGEVRVATRAVAVNFPDLLMVAGQYQLKPPFPFVPGIEVAGTVDAVGPGVAGWFPGERVMARLDLGGYAEAVCVHASRLLRMPAAMSFTDGAAFTVGYGTTYHALVERAGLRVGEVLLVLGASGGVGLTAVELGKRMGAIVIAAGGDDGKLGAAREYGADVVVNYRRESVREVVKRVTEGAGADVVYDPVGGEAADEAVRSLAWGGRFLVIGFASGTVPQIPANRLLIKGASAVGVIWGIQAERNPDAAAEAYRRLIGLYQHGALRPKVSRTVPFAEAPAAIASLADRSVVGRVVVSVEE